MQGRTGDGTAAKRIDPANMVAPFAVAKATGDPKGRRWDEMVLGEGERAPRSGD